MRSKVIVLNHDEYLALFKQDPAMRNRGGFQSFIVRLQNQYRPGTQELRLTEQDLDDIPRYAFDYEDGGWERDMKAIFERHLGATLGRSV